MLTDSVWRKGSAFWLVLVVAVTATLVGCENVNLTSIHDFAAQTSLAKVSFDDLSEDWLETCIRRTEYSRQTPAELSLVPLDSSILREGPALDCTDAATFANQWQIRNDLVVAYIRALGGLADVSSVPKGTDTLAAGLSDIGALPKGDKGAFSDLASKIASAAVAGKQKHEIAAFARDNNDALLIASADLRFIADRYDEQLVNESNTLDQMYRDTLRAQVAGGTSSLPEPSAFEAHRLDVEATREQWESRRSDLRFRHQKAAAYRHALDTIANAHADIVNHAGRFTRADLATILKGYSTSFGDDLATLTRSFVK